VFDGSGNLDGTTSGGPAHGFGLVFALKKPTGKVHTWAETVLHPFSDGNDGANPAAGLTLDTNGNLYGAAEYGGSAFRGTLFQLKPPGRKGVAWIFSFIYAFAGSPDGAYPAAKLILDKNGKLYGTTQGGGTGTSCSGYCGTVFEVSP
jgi:hypothetical protein